ncbi:MAG: SsrA-binding protein, partial [Candidatus Shikimatogenerans sp. JK-2022]|nr:SsrA-binding protein [Candidatus Shikimatogenerans bostrichidophilus]
FESCRDHIMIMNYIIKNKKAYYNYNLIRKFNAGMILLGKEIKLIRQKKCNIYKAYCKSYNNNIYLLNFKIHKINLREIKLLLYKEEINKINQQLKNNNYTIIPTKIFISKSGFAKVEIYLSISKKKYEKKRISKKKEKEINEKRLKKYYF